eukprot:TRINITY_DN1121_c0_g1_i5.p2 TRINITY_DN1121_c0_g1~~TRINITY_DN1121_c0_g1_i5.p2  ORF type:complete len:154 (-),score=47.13 TRINITY_DN1121_c0_g1_i5:344-805(-)
MGRRDRIFFFFFKQKTAYEIMPSLVGSEMCIRDRYMGKSQIKKGKERHSIQGNMGKGKGTQSFGKRHTTVHTLCRRCGKVSFHIQRKRCASCAYPAARTRIYGMTQKESRRKSVGTGRMRYLRHIPRLAKNGFRSGTTPKPRVRKAVAAKQMP